ncbi:sigma-70 family RNA polymerase sigma factor [Nakamurella flava]|uniref:sigma-70 family RNA polymerase sigma factor n=1 Tax=Nakamurella flava TaxID=2576308 RepID=UPI0014072EF9|nr:sigma-70 family RNA polymerase sigma factor [Nakamurella flava]
MPPEDLFSVGVLDRPSTVQLPDDHIVPALDAAPTIPAVAPSSPSPAPADPSAAPARPGQPLSSAPSRERAARCRDLLDQALTCGNEARARRLRGEVVEAYLPAARSIAARYAGRGVDRADLEQLASIGLVKAARRWQPGLSEDFLQFAVPTMVGEIKRYFRDHSFVVRPTRRVQELRAQVRQAQHDHWQRHGSDPTDHDLAVATGADVADVREARAASGVCRPPSLDEPQGAGWAITQTLGEVDDRIGDIENRMMVARLLQSLTERERRVVQLRFEMQWSQSQIGQELGVSQMQISRWLRAITIKLREVATQ